MIDLVDRTEDGDFLRQTYIEVKSGCYKHSTSATPILWRIGMNPHTPHDILWELIERYPFCKVDVLANKACPIDLLLRLSTDDDLLVCERASKRLAKIDLFDIFKED